MPGTPASGNRTKGRDYKACTATRSDGVTPCKAPAMLNGKCRVHGGASPGGVKSPHWVQGRWSKYLPERLIPLVAAAQRDPDKLSLERDLELVDARIASVLQNLHGQDTVPDWLAAKECLAAFNEAQRKGKNAVPLMRQAMDALTAILDRGAGDVGAWGELGTLIEQRRRLIESEEKRAVVTGKAVPADQVLNMAAAMMRAVLDEVTDPVVRERVARRMAAIVQGRRSPLALPLFEAQVTEMRQ